MPKYRVTLVTSRLLSAVLHLARFVASILIFIFFGAALSVHLPPHLMLFAVVQLCFAAALFLHHKRNRVLRRLLCVSGLLLAVLLLLNMTRLTSPAQGKLIAVPQAAAPGFINRLFDEELAVLSAIKILPYAGGITRQEAEGLLPKTKVLYSEMRHKRGRFATPLFSTWLGLERDNRFDLLIFDPPVRGDAPERRVLVFFHGAGGNWTLICWIIAEAAAEFGLSTACPSVGPSGAWHTEQGGAVLDLSTNYLKESGYSIRYLGGISNGAVGASVLAARYPSLIKGVIILFGGLYNGAGRSAPTLAVSAASDKRYPPPFIDHGVAAQRHTGTEVTHLTIAGDHFAIVKDRERVVAALSNWLRTEEQRQ